MTRPLPILRLVAALMGCLGAFGNAARADVTVTAAASSQRVAVGDSFTLQISVEGTQSIQPLDLPAIDGFSSQPAGTSRNIEMVNGRMTQKFVMSWQLTPTRKGRLTIPEISVTAGGSSYMTRPITISAIEPTESPDFKLRLTSDKDAAYVGEPVHVRLTCYLGKDVRGAQFNGPDGGKAFDIAPGPDPRPAGRTANVRGNDPRYPAVPFNGTEVIGQVGQGELDGAQVATFIVDLTVTPRQAGEITVGPYTGAFNVAVGQRQGDFLDSPFFDRTVTKRAVVTSNSVKLSVKALPENGRPAGFNGLIGEYGISATAGAREANVGDPVPLTLRITGPEPMDSVAAPDLSDLPGFEGFKPGPEGWQRAAASHGERTFTTTIRPRTDKVTEVPPVPLSFFDTARGEYRTARSQPIPLKVAPTREVTTADATGGTVKSAPPPAGKPLESGPGGIHANYEDDRALVNRGVSVIEFAGHPLGAIVLAGPPALCLALTLVRARRTDLSAAARRRRARAGAKSLLRRAQNCESIAAAVAEYLGGALDLEPSAITSADVRSSLSAAGSALGDRVESFLARCERARYGNEPLPAPALRDEAAGLVADLHTELERLS